MSNAAATTKTYSEILMTADKHGKPRFSIVFRLRSFPIKRAEALASIENGCRVYIGNFDDLIHQRGHYATAGELADWL